MYEPRDHGVDDERQQHEAEDEADVAERLGDVFPAEPFVAHAIIVQLAGRHEAVIPAFAFVEHFRFGNAAGENHRIHRKFFNTKMRVEKMDAEDESCREQRLIRVQDEGDVDDPPGQEARKKFREPHDETRRADDGDAPEHGEVIELLPIRPAVKIRLRDFAKKPFVVRYEIAPVLHRRQHGIGAEDDRVETLNFQFAGFRIAQLDAAFPGFANERSQMQREI